MRTRQLENHVQRPTVPISSAATTPLQSRQRRLGWLWSSRHQQVVVPLLLIWVISLAGTFAPQTVDLAALLVVVPASTALFSGPMVTGAATLLAGAAGISLDIHDGRLLTWAVPLHASAMLVVSGLAIVFAALRERHDKELTQVRAVAEFAQRVVLRPLPSRLGPLLVAATYQASTAHAEIGGDLYAAVRTTTGTRVIIGDVRGKGLQAVHEAAAVLGAFREIAYCYNTLAELAAHLELSVRRHLQEIAEVDQDAGERFVTALLLEIPDEGRVVRTVSCGHPGPLLSGGGQVKFLNSRRPGPPLGLGSLSADDYHQDTFPFTVGDTLVLYTDGVVEARDTAGTFYPTCERVASWTGTDPEQLLHFIQDDVRRHTNGNWNDDAAMVALTHASAHTANATHGIENASRVPNQSSQHQA
ncbi:PP2C family protein-serine/threonine phosphatase [Streptomyces sp. NPDC054919]